MADTNMQITIDLHQWLIPAMTVIIPQLLAFGAWLWRLDRQVAAMKATLETLLALLPQERHGND